MQINFIKILAKPLTYKNIPMTFIKAFFLFLPALLAFFIVGITNWIFISAASIALIVLLGYFLIIFKQELEEDTKKFPEKNFIDALFTGIKGFIFSLIYTILYGIGLAILLAIVYYLPDFKDSALIIAIFGFICLIFMFYPISMGIFSDKYNSAETIDFSVIFQIIGNAWLNYLIAFIYMTLYVLILGLICMGLLVLTKYSFNYYIMGFFTLYAIVVYFILYAHVYRRVRTEFESHI